MRKMYKLMICLFLAGTIQAQTLQINEFLASNVANLQDPNNEFDDWIELHNYGTDAVLLDNMYITDSKSNLKKYRFPVGSGSVAAGGFILIWADNQSSQGNLHTNFALAKGGEFIGISDTSGTVVLDSLAFGAQQDDISYGRTNNGSNWQTFETPTPNASNGTASAKTLVSVDKSVIIFPNPAKELISVKSTKNIISIELKNIIGSSIVKTTERNISLNGLESGIYFLLIELTNGEYKTMKFTKN
jgi:hypothetical protein